MIVVWARCWRLPVASVPSMAEVFRQANRSRPSYGQSFVNRCPEIFGRIVKR